MLPGKGITSLQPVLLACSIRRYCLLFIFYLLHSLFSLVTMWLASTRPSLAQLVLPGCICIEGSSASSLFRLLACLLASIRRYCTRILFSALAVLACDHLAGIIPSAHHSRSLCYQAAFALRAHQPPACFACLHVFDDTARTFYLPH